MDNKVELMNKIRYCENIISRTKSKKNNLPHGHGRIMSAIYKNNGVTQCKLADILDIRPQSLTRVLLQLEERGLIYRERDDSDRRNVAVYISEEGKKHHEQIQLSRAHFAQEVFGCLNEEEQDELNKLLGKVIASYNEREKDKA